MMNKAHFKKPNSSKDKCVKSVLNERKFICVSLSRKRWSKKYLTRSYRRKHKQEKF